MKRESSMLVRWTWRQSSAAAPATNAAATSRAAPRSGRPNAAAKTNAVTTSKASRHISPRTKRWPKMVIYQPSPLMGEGLGGGGVNEGPSLLRRRHPTPNPSPSRGGAFPAARHKAPSQPMLPHPPVQRRSGEAELGGGEADIVAVLL